MTHTIRYRNLSLALVGCLSFAGCNQPSEPAAQSTSSSPQADAPAARKAQNALPPQLAKIIAERRAACDGKVGPNFANTQQADFNADGKPDYILSQENFLCADEVAGQQLWGIAGPQYDFLVSTPDGYADAEGFTARYGIVIVKRAAGDVLQTDWEDRLGQGCPGPVKVTWAWTGKMMAVSDRRNEKGEKVDERGCSASVGGGLPIKPGYYGHEADGCSVAMRKYTNGVTIGDKFWGDIDGDYPLSPVKNLGNGKYKLGDAAEVRVTGPNSFVADEGTEYERRFVWCAAKAPQ